MNPIFIIVNILKLALWLEAIFVLTGYFGSILGTVIIVVSAIGWNLYATATGNYRREQDPWPVFRRQIAAKFVGIFIDFGNFNGPKWGRDSANRDLKPICGLDDAAYSHDEDMSFAKKLEDPVERRKAKNTGDLLFIGRAWTSDNTCHGFYVFGATFGFLLRVIGRTLTGF